MSVGGGHLIYKPVGSQSIKTSVILYSVKMSLNTREFGSITDIDTKYPLYLLRPGKRGKEQTNVVFISI